MKLVLKQHITLVLEVGVVSIRFKAGCALNLKLKYYIVVKEFSLLWLNQIRPRMVLLLLLIVIIEANDEGVGDGAGDDDVGSGGGQQGMGSSMFLGGEKNKKYI